MPISFDAYIPLFCPLGKTQKSRRIKFIGLIQEILAVWKIYPFVSECDEDISATISEAKYKSKWPAPIRKNAGNWSNQIVVKFSGQLHERAPRPDTWEVEHVDKHGIEAWNNERLDYVLTAFQKDIFDIVLLSNVAAPHCLQSGVGAWNVDGKFFRSIEELYSGSPDVPEAADQYGWPEIRDIPLSQVVEWAIKCPGFLEGFSTNPAGRALGALSYLYRPTSSRDETLDIFWIMLALEALYCSRKEGLSQQLHERTQLYLGPRHSFKKKLKDAYAFRSDLIHGSMNFPFSHCPWDGMEPYGKFSSDMVEAYFFVLATLLGTLQKMCNEGRYSLSFVETLEPYLDVI